MMADTEREFDPGNASDVVSAFLQFVHTDDESDQNMIRAWAMLAEDARGCVGRSFAKANPEFVDEWDDDSESSQDRFKGWLRDYLRDRLPLPRFDPEPYSVRLSWAFGMSLVQLVEPEEAEPCFAFFVQRVDNPDTPNWPWRIHSFAPLAQPAAA